MNKLNLKFAVALAFSGIALSANAVSYTFADLGTLGGSISTASAINASGQVVGYAYLTGDLTKHATLWNGTIATDLGALGGIESEAKGINESGQVVGFVRISNSETHATLWNGGTTTTLYALGGTSSALAINTSGRVVGNSKKTNNPYDDSGYAVRWDDTDAAPYALDTLGGHADSAVAINASGQVVGTSTLSDYTYHATLWNGSSATDLGTLGGSWSRASAINAHGQIVGIATTSNDEQHATLWNGNTVIDLGAGEARAINTFGQIVGITRPTSNLIETHATLWNGTTAIDLNSLLDASTVAAGWVLTDANGINDNGWIVGNATNNSLGIFRHAFLLSVTTVPEPETYAMLMMGLGLVGFMARIRSNKLA
ncbi:MAG: PEP-CTERM sorting domain-containing protein [Methylophilaceae bacterium]